MKSLKHYILIIFLCSGITKIHAMQISEIPIQVQAETREVLQQTVGELRATINDCGVTLQQAIHNIPREFSRSLLNLSIGVTGLALIAGTLWNMMHQDDSHPQNRKAQTAALALGFTSLTYSLWTLKR